VIRVTRRALATFAPYRRPGYLEAVEAAALRADDKAVWLDEKGYEELRLKFRRCGPGCHLTRAIAWFGVRDDGKCGCGEHAAQMDAWGPDECERQIETIMGWLKDAAAKRFPLVPWVDAPARMLVERAIAAARRDATPAPGDDRPA
jgi:hypothetical protein